MTSPGTIALKGGYPDSGFTSQPAGSYTTIKGSMKIRERDAQGRPGKNQVRIDRVHYGSLKVRERLSRFLEMS